MTNDSIHAVLAVHPFFSGLSADHRNVLAACARHVVLDAGEVLFQRGEAADTLYAISDGRVVVELDSGGGPRVVDTVTGGEVVGWSWLFPPYRVHFDVRVVERSHAVMFDGVTLRLVCDEDPRLGYEVLRRVAVLLAHRLDRVGALLSVAERRR